jgi:hypothetical protein
MLFIFVIPVLIGKFESIFFIGKETLLESSQESSYAY